MALPQKWKASRPCTLAVVRGFSRRIRRRTQGKSRGDQGRMSEFKFPMGSRCLPSRYLAKLTGRRSLPCPPRRPDAGPSRQGAAGGAAALGRRFPRSAFTRCQRRRALAFCCERAIVLVPLTPPSSCRERGSQVRTGDPKRQREPAGLPSVKVASRRREVRPIGRVQPVTMGPAPRPKPKRPPSRPEGRCSKARGP